MLKFIHSQRPPSIQKTDTFILFFENEGLKKSVSFPKSIAPQFKNYLKNMIRSGDFKAEFKELLPLYPNDIPEINRLILVGLGTKSHLNNEKLREIGYKIGKLQQNKNSKRLILYVDNLRYPNLQVIDSLSEGLLYSTYAFNLYKTEKKETVSIRRVIFVDPNKGHKSTFKKVEAVAKGVKLARDLTNRPANELTPSILKQIVQNNFKNRKSIKLKSFNKKELQEKRFNSLLAVAKGSIEEPYLLIIHHKPKNPNGKKIVIVGKGVTFDSGGISIKPSAQMEDMKFDMAGAGATIGILEVASLLQVNSEIIGIIPAVENMPGGKAVKPGDIIQAYNGKTIEITNTDAEGRLILADALAYAADHYKPNVIIDFATLTGAVTIALGDKMAALFSNSDKLAQIFINAGNICGDRVWRLPLFDAYSKQLESKYADLKNVGGRLAGTITAAKFLEYFIRDYPWVHLDIAGTAYDVKNIEYLAEGATGYGPRLFFRALADLEKNI